MKEVYRKRGRIVVAIAFVQLVAALGLMIAGVLNEWFTSFQSNLIMGVGLLLYWVLSDIVEPRVAHRFDDITDAQKKAYPKYILWDFIGYAGIAYFLLGMGNTQSSSLVGAIAYALSMKPKRENQDIFLGIVVPEEEAEEEEEMEEQQAEEPAAIEQQSEE